MTTLWHFLLLACEVAVAEREGGRGAQFSPVSLKSRVSMGGWSAGEEDGDKEDKGKVMEMVEANKESKEGRR